MLPELITLCCIYYNVWTRFHLLLCTRRVRSSRPEGFCKKGVPQIYSRKIFAQGSLLQKTCRLEACNPVKYRIWYRCFPVKFLEILKSIYFANVCDGMPLKSKIFTGASFRIMLGFYYKRKRQLFYYKGTSS